MSTLAERGKDSPPVDIDDEMEFDMSNVRVLVSKKIEELLEESNPYVSMPAVYGDHDGRGGPPPDDPLQVMIHLPFGPEDNEPFWTFSLVDVVGDFLAEADDSSYAQGLSRIAEALSALSEKIKAAVAEGEANAPDRTVIE